VKRLGLVGLLIMVWAHVATCAAQSSDTLLTTATKGYLCIPDVHAVEEKWEKTQLGQLAKEPIMKPFADDLRNQIHNRLVESNINVNLEWNEIREVCTGEFCIAAVQPDSNEGHASVMILDVTGRQDQASRLQAKLSDALVARGAKPKIIKESGHDLLIHELPRERGQLNPNRVIRFLAANRLVISNHENVARKLLKRLVTSDTSEALALSEPFQKTVGRSQAVDPDTQCQIRWFVEPFGLAKLAREADETPRRRGKDMLAILRSQGFDAVRGIGGVIHIAMDNRDLLHRSFIFAPKVEGAEPGQKYKLAARMLDFPNDTAWNVESWVPDDVATRVSLRWKTKEAFEYSSTLVDAILDEEEFFNSVLESLATDPDGPKVDVRNQFIAYLDDQITVVTDHSLPVTTTSERTLVAVRVTDPQQVAETLKKTFETDPTAHSETIANHVVWVIVNQPDDEPLDIPDPIAHPDLKDPVDAESDAKEDEREHLLTSYALTVANGYVLGSTHKELIEEVLNRTDTQQDLSENPVFQLVQREVDAIGAGTDSLRYFTRTDAAYQTNYELIRQGKMPQSESMLGKLLNQILGEPKKDVVRQQRLDAKNLPEFEQVRRYFGPAGGYSRSEEDGWFISGVLLNTSGLNLADQPDNVSGPQASNRN
jgi:hypothetical protein